MILITGILLPIAAYLGLILYLGNRWDSKHTGSLLLRAAAISTAYLVLALEALSLVRGITWPGMVTAWLLPGLILWALLFRRRYNGYPVHLPRLRLPAYGWERLLLGMIVAVLIITFTVAWISPPQTWDSLTYHLSRVAHWAQNRSIDHFITGIERQNSMSPGAELLVLNTYVLTGGDRLANYPQWLAMLGSLVAVSLGAKFLGAKPLGQWLAACFIATLPMGIAQASSTATDYVTTFWLVYAAVEVLHYHVEQEPSSPFFASLAAALALLTKPVSVPYLLPFAVWMVVLIMKRSGWKVALRWGTAALIIVTAVNGGFLARNLVTYRHIANPADFQYHSNQLRSLTGLISILSRNAGMHAGLARAPEWNDNIFKVVLRIHMLLGLEMEDPRTTLVGYFQVRPPSTQEDFATNPYHAYLALGVFVLMLPLWRSLERRTVLYASSAALGFILFSFIYKWQIFGARFHLLFFVLFAPVVGTVLSKPRFKPLTALLAAVLLILSFPWLSSIDSRPLYPKQVQGESILLARRDELYFSNATGVEEGVRAITAEIQHQGCSQVGLMLHGDDPEYLFWRLLGAPRKTLTLEWIVAGTPSARYRTQAFQPCAIICSGCPQEQVTLGDLHRQYENSGFVLYMKE
jgi:hypothetical protein